MKRVAVLYATRDGQSKKISARVAKTLADQGFQVDLLDVKASPPTSLAGYVGVALVASIHGGKHEPEMLDLVRNHKSELERVPTLFLSVSLTQAGVERADNDEPVREHARALVAGMLDQFVQETGWRPTELEPVAGALPYSRYNPILRFIMKRIVKKFGGDTDTSHDYEYTDWDEVDRVSAELARVVNA